MRKSLDWFAGLLEGEGSFKAMKRGKAYYPQVVVGSVDLDIIMKFVTELNFTGPYTTPAGVGHQTFYRCALSRTQDAIAFMVKLFPLMGLRRREQIKNVLEKVGGMDALLESLNPGSDAAIDCGCGCPVIDNHYGRGYAGQTGVFVYNEDCNLHGGQQ